MICCLELTTYDFDGRPNIKIYLTDFDTGVIKYKGTICPGTDNISLIDLTPRTTFWKRVDEDQGDTVNPQRSTSLVKEVKNAGQLVYCDGDREKGLKAMYDIIIDLIKTYENYIKFNDYERVLMHDDFGFNENSKIIARFFASV